MGNPVRPMTPLAVLASMMAGEPSVPTRTAVVILQHPHERAHPFGTARLVGLCLPNARIHTAYRGLTGNLECPIDVPRDLSGLSIKNPRIRVVHTTDPAHEGGSMYLPEKLTLKP